MQKSSFLISSGTFKLLFGKRIKSNNTELYYYKLVSKAVNLAINLLNRILVLYQIYSSKTKKLIRIMEVKTKNIKIILHPFNTYEVILLCLDSE